MSLLGSDEIFLPTISLLLRLKIFSATALKTRTLSQASSVMIPSSTVCTTVSISRRMDSLLWLRWLISRVSAIRSFTYFAVT